MKNLFYSLASFMATAFALQATVLTVSNSPEGGAQYSSLSAAYSAAAAGDTLYLEGTNISYTAPSRFDKPLTFIGSGHLTTANNYKRTIINRHATIEIRSGASNSNFLGIIFYRDLSMNGANNIYFSSCRFESYLTIYSGYSAFISRCAFSRDNAININAGGDLTLQNSVLDGSIQDNNLSNTTIIDHCIFLTSAGNAALNIDGGTVKNSIFVNTKNIVDANASGISFLNNILVQDTTVPSSSGHTGSGNLTNTDPLFVNYTSGQLFSGNHNYDVQAGSPAINAATDGTNIGVHGGALGFTETGEVQTTPYMRVLLINNTSVAPNGTIQVQVQATIPAQD